MSNNMYGSYENEFEDLMAPDGTFEEEWEAAGDPEDEMGNFEDELSLEDEMGNFEDELSLEDEMGNFEDELSLEDEMDPFDMEGADPFLGGVMNAIPGPVRGALKGLARTGAAWAGNAIGGQRGERIGQGVADAVLNNVDWESSDMEEESDPFGDLEAVGGDSHVLHEMSHLATLAAEAESEEEADQFLGAIAGLAGKLLPKLLGGLGEEENWEGERDEFFPALLPLIGPAVQAIGGLFKQQGETALMETLPVIAAKSAANIAKNVQSGKPVTPSKVAAIVAKHTAKTLATKPAIVKAVQANKEMAYRRPAPAIRRPVYSRPAPARPVYRAPAFSRPIPTRAPYRRPGYAGTPYRRPGIPRSYRRPGYRRPYRPTGYRPGTYRRPGYRRPGYRRPMYGRANYRLGTSWRPNYGRRNFRPGYNYGGGYQGRFYSGYGQGRRVIRPRYCVY